MIRDLPGSDRPEGVPGPVPIIFDCDTGVDDAIAILFGARNGAEFAACTVTHGNVPVDIGARNTLTVLDRVGLESVPVYRGASRPLAQPLRTAEWVHGADGLGNTNHASSVRSLEPTPAAIAMAEMAAARPGELTLVPVGPLTNVALALMLDENFAANIKRVVLMGGAIGVPGNATPTAEANTMCDPEAAALVLDAAWDVTWVGLEATVHTALTPAMIDRLGAVTTPEGTFMWEVMQFYMNLYERNLGYRTCLLHDPLAMALALDEGLASYTAHHASIELTGTHTRGMVVADLRANADPVADARAPGVIKVVDKLNVALFHERFLAGFGL